LGFDPVYIPVIYGQPMPHVKSDSIVYILDFSYPAETLIQLVVEGHCRVILLDHHKTAQADLEKINVEQLPGLSITFDMDESGATLAWKHFFPDTHIPAMIQYIRDRDLWLWELPWSKEISAALTSYPFDFPTWEVMLAMDDDDYVQGMHKEGQVCLRLKSQMVDQMCKHARIATIGGYDVPVVNATVFYSEVGDKLCEENSDKPFAAYFSLRGDGKYQYGLRSRNGFDVSEIARQYGGGGHAAAAGFVSDSVM